MMTAQTPQKIAYQAVVRRENNQLVVNANIGIRVSIIEDNIYGSSVYVERHSVITNSNGLASFDIGSGVSEYGVFDTISWGSADY
ncbi:MAG: hypothetical protein RL220_369, partial [Bacteroidota bacterium]